MKTLADHLFADWNELETSEEYKIMKNYAIQGRRYSLGYSCKYKLLLVCIIMLLYKNAIQ